MKLRFRTRLTLSVAFLTAITVAVMSAALMMVAVASVGASYTERGRVLTELARRTISYSAGLADSVTERMADQMVVSALLAAELVYASETGTPLSPEEIGNRLRRVIKSSRDVNGTALVDEFWITDEKGNAYIRTEPDPFTFTEDGTQANDFLALLQPDAKPVVQSIQPRALDGAPFLYAGVSGVDKPRIVQVGMRGAQAAAIREQFHMRNVLERFLHEDRDRGLKTEVTKLVVVQADGTVLASAAKPSPFRETDAEQKIVETCTRYLENPGEPFLIDQVNVAPDIADLAVVVPLRTEPGALPAALYVQHRTKTLLDVIRTRIETIAAVGLCLVLVAILVSMWLSRRLTRPINELMAAVEAFDGKQFGVRAEVKGDKEFVQFARSFNDMARRIERHDTDMRQEVSRRERLESEMRIGAQVQRDLLPDASPSTARITFAGWSRPAIQVGGDFYDYSELSEHRLSIALGDATGKGLGAALLTTECAAVLRAMVQYTDSPAAQLGMLNKALHRHLGPSGRFVTLFSCVIDTAAQRLVYANAGHNPPLLVSTTGEAPPRVLREEGNLPLGIEATTAYEDAEVALEPGHTLVLYSDGVTEAHNRDREMFGLDRLRDVLMQHRAASPEAMRAAIEQAILAHVGDVEQHDDMTLAIVRFDPV